MSHDWYFVEKYHPRLESVKATSKKQKSAPCMCARARVCTSAYKIMSLYKLSYCILRTHATQLDNTLKAVPMIVKPSVAAGEILAAVNSCQSCNLASRALLSIQSRQFVAIIIFFFFMWGNCTSNCTGINFSNLYSTFFEVPVQPSSRALSPFRRGTAFN